MRMRSFWHSAAATAAILSFSTPSFADGTADAIADVTAAVAPVKVWDGPKTGPKAAKDKFVIYISDTETNAGAAGVEAGAAEAAKAIGWRFKAIDGKGTANSQAAAMEQALALKPDGIVTGSLAADQLNQFFVAAAEKGIKLVTWHGFNKPGVIPEYPSIYYNISSDPTQIAKLAGEYAVSDSGGKAKAVVLTDPQFKLIITKVKGMTDAIESCSMCKVLAVDNAPYTEISQRMPSLMNALMRRYDKDLGYVLSVNDLYFDFSVPTLRGMGLSPDSPPHLISAGDGSVSAYERIRDGVFQVATVPEPLNLHGWQAVDELNRAFAGQAPSGYVTKVHLVTKQNIDADGGPDNRFDPGNGYRDAYKAIWNAN